MTTTSVRNQRRYPKQRRGSSKKKAKRAPSGRCNRTKAADDGDSDGPETSEKNLSDVTRVIVSLSKRCGGYRTIHVGHLRGHVCIDQQETIARRINDAVGILNRDRAMAVRRTEMIIDDIWRSNRDIHLLQQLTHGGKGGANYWTNLLRMIIDGQICGTGPVYRPILEKVQALWGDDFLEKLSSPDSDITTPIKRCLFTLPQLGIHGSYELSRPTGVRRSTTSPTATKLKLLTETRFYRYICSKV
ncbi:hypothetical protein SeLEV6574_g02391 [Synchytrium endobioticum]|uniref:Uncharacterized protein n=1 Tax=Synchytrium endobioticum TaxID=286115 RepID=A0A507DAG4_9FUNG|nr:hypothetical protein SeLEV6574_g02391 [Synchytrium endobioticum]